jgi:hypothetical protein
MTVNINDLYQANLGRAPDAEGLAYWQNLANTGMTADQVKDAFYRAAAQEVQRDDSGLSANVDAWDENRIVESMRSRDALDDKFGSDYSFWNSAGDTQTMTAAQRLGTLSPTYFDRTAATDAAGITGGSAGGSAAKSAREPVRGRNRERAREPAAAMVPGLSTNQEALLKALMDQQEMDRITGEMRGNANELYDRAQGYEQDQLRDIAAFTGGNSGIYNRYQPDIENDVGMAVADARTGQTAALNTAARQAMRYGINMPTGLAGVNSTQASQLAAAANNTRNNSINNYRNLVGQGIGMKDGTFRTSQAATADSMGRAEGASMAGRNMRIQNDALDWGKQLDVTGMARGMPGASQGAYGVAVGAGNSAVQNQMAPGQALIGAMGQAGSMTMGGQQMAMQGLSGILGSQTSAYNAGMSQDNGMMGAIGTIGGAAITAF